MKPSGSVLAVPNENEFSSNCAEKSAPKSGKGNSVDERRPLSKLNFFSLLPSNTEAGRCASVAVLWFKKKEKKKKKQS